MATVGGRCLCKIRRKPRNDIYISARNSISLTSVQGGINEKVHFTQCDIEKLKVYVSKVGK